MTQVTSAVAMSAVSWDGALVTALARPAAPASPGSLPVVHSVHRRVANLRAGDVLIALAGEEVDDAPSTVRVPVADWTALGLAPGQPVDFGDHRIRIHAEPTLTVLVRTATAWTPPTHQLGSVPLHAFSAAARRIAAEPAPAVETPFGRASAALLAARTSILGDALRTQDPGAIATAAAGLLGLGEGLTPSGDDVLTGVAFLATQPGMLLYGARDALAAALETGTARTTLLSVVTIRHALAARGRQSLHDLAAALERDDDGAFSAAVARIAAIGHTSGSDLLAGIRLALEVELSLRATIPSPSIP